MITSLSHSVDKVSLINKKLEKSENKFIDNVRTMLALLSHSIDNLSVVNKKIEKSENKFIDNYRTMLASLSYSVDKTSEINKKLSLIQLSEKFPNTYQLCNKYLNKFAILLRKGVYPYEYIANYERLIEESLTNKEYFYNELNKEDITDEDHKHAQKVWKEFNIKNLGEYHDLYVQSDTTLLADVFENSRNKCIEIYELDPAHFLLAPGLAWQACLKKDRSKIRVIK